MNGFLNDDENIADLVSQMDAGDRQLYAGLSHTRYETAFDGRYFVLFKVRDGRPAVLTKIRVFGMYADATQGAYTTLEDITTGQTMTVGHIPSRLFDYDAVVYIPHALRVRWDARGEVGGKLRRRMSFTLAVQTKDRVDRRSEGVTYVETPNAFREMYPEEPRINLHS